MDMKKLLLLFTILIIVGCTSEPKVKYSPSFKDDPVNKSFKSWDRFENMSMEELDRELDSLNAKGEYCLVRGADRDLDTVIDHVHYIFTTEE